MSDAGPEDLTDLAGEYLKSLDSGSSGEMEELREDLDYWGEKAEEFEEGTSMHQLATEEIDEAQEQLDAIEAKDERLEELRTELLTRASKEFAPKGEWLDPDVIKALSHALTGRQMEQLVIGEHTLPVDADELSKREMVPVAITVHALAKDAVGCDERITDLWTKLDTDTQRSILGVLAHHDEPLRSGDISDELGEDGTDSPGSNIRYLRNETDIDPYYSTDEGYMLTLAGRYVWAQYGDDAAEQVSEKKEEEADTEEAGPGETTEHGEEETTSADDSSGSTGNVDLSSFEVKE